MFSHSGRINPGFPVYRGFHNIMESPYVNSVADVITETDDGELGLISVRMANTDLTPAEHKQDLEGASKQSSAGDYQLCGRTTANNLNTGEHRQDLEAINKKLATENSQLCDRLKLMKNMFINESISHDETKKKLTELENLLNNCKKPQNEVCSHVKMVEEQLKQEQDLHKDARKELNAALQKIQLLENTPTRDHDGAREDLPGSIFNLLLEIRRMFMDDKMSQASTSFMVRESLQKLFLSHHMFKENVDYRLSYIFNKMQEFHNGIDNGNMQTSNSCQMMGEADSDTSRRNVQENEGMKIPCKMMGNADFASSIKETNMRKSNSENIPGFSEVSNVSVSTTYEPLPILPVDQEAATSTENQDEEHGNSDEEPIVDSTRFPDYELNFILMSINQYYTLAETQEWKLHILLDMCENLSTDHALIFCKSKKIMEWLTNELQIFSFQACSVSPEPGSEEKNREIMKDFTDKKYNFLITTDCLVARTGVSLVPVVINYDIPHHLGNYIHRASRCRPMGRKGVVINLILWKEMRILEHLQTFYKTNITELPLNLADIYG